MFPVEGQFSTLRGQVRIDPARQFVTVEARIVADTVSMRREGTENWARSAEFFDVERFPEIEFRSVSFPIKMRCEGGDLPGRLTMRRPQPAGTVQSAARVLRRACRRLRGERPG